MLLLVLLLGGVSLLAISEDKSRVEVGFFLVPGFPLRPVIDARCRPLWLVVLLLLLFSTTLELTLRRCDCDPSGPFATPRRPEDDDLLVGV